jgi:hypothetical protein
MRKAKFSRGARVTLLLVGLFSVWTLAGMLYFFALPTDGWLAKPPDAYGVAGLVYLENVAGAHSDLQPQDHVVEIQGNSLTFGMQNLSDWSAGWQVGNTVQYGVERGENQVQVAVPLVQWQWFTALEYLARQGGIGAVGLWAFVAISALAFFKRPDDHAAQALFLFSAAFALLSIPIQTAISSPLAVIFTPLGTIGVVTIVLAFTVLLPPTLLRLALVFPRPKPLIVRHPRLEYVPYLIGVGIIPLFLLSGGAAGYAWTIFSIVGAIVILIHSAFTMRDALSRAQLLWGVWGFVLGMAMFLSTYLVLFAGVTGVWADLINVLTNLSFSVLGITLAIAILRYRLFDIGIIIRRTVTYAIVVGLLLIVYFGSVILLQQVFARITGQRSEVITVLSTLAIAALFIPLRNRVQNAVDKRFNRKKYDAQQVLQKFARTVRDETDLEKLTAELVNVVNETMQPKSLSVWLKTETPRPNSREGML